MNDGNGSPVEEKPQYPDLPEFFRKSCKRMKKEIQLGYPAKVIALEAMQILRSYFGPGWLTELQKIEAADRAEYERLVQEQKEKEEPDETM
jgi:hypothetical protein